MVGHIKERVDKAPLMEEAKGKARNLRKLHTWAKLVWLGEVLTLRGGGHPWVWNGAPLLQGLKKTGWETENPSEDCFLHVDYDPSRWDVQWTETLSNEPGIALCLSRQNEVLCKHWFPDTLKNSNTPTFVDQNWGRKSGALGRVAN